MTVQDGGSATVLSIRGLDAFYGAAQALRDFSVELRGGEVLCLLGRNGAGKTTALKAIMGTVHRPHGRLVLDGRDISGLAPEAVPREGIAHVPQGRRLFSDLTVAENLQIGLNVRPVGRRGLSTALALFPVLAERMSQRAGTLSGGEQTMLSIARAMCLDPKVILLDEPTEGLMPAAIARIREAVAQLRAAGVAVLLVEQRVDAVLPVADRVAFMENGTIRARLDIAEVRADPSVLNRYVGLGG